MLLAPLAARLMQLESAVRLGSSRRELNPSGTAFATASAVLSMSVEVNKAVPRSRN